MNVHRMVMEDRHVDPGIQGSHRPISFIRTKHTWYLVEHARTIFCVKLSINNHIVGLVHKKHYTNVSDVPRSLQS